jgi:hypothetical protein
MPRTREFGSLRKPFSPAVKQRLQNTLRSKPVAGAIGGQLMLTEQMLVSEAETLNQPTTLPLRHALSLC